jgi:2-polyprenyl-3-methyl-5-hydroxy-6-metoxy-1,4-benzoquinol methylase
MELMEELQGLITKQKDIDSEICQEIFQNFFKTLPHYERKVWEYLYCIQMLNLSGNLTEGKKGLGFGCGEDILVPALANIGCKITATDQSLEDAKKKGWTAEKGQKGKSKGKVGRFFKRIVHILKNPGKIIDFLYYRQHQKDNSVPVNQHSSGIDSFSKFIPLVCDFKTLKTNTTFEVCDMNDIDEKFSNSYDFIWSCCAFEHLGSIEKGLDFVKNSMKCLKKGGIAVHTTEINVDSLEDDYNGDTLETEQVVIFRKSDFIKLGEILKVQGYHMYPIDFSAGNKILDRHIDLPPYSHTHLKLKFLDYKTTSIGIVIQK